MKKPEYNAGTPLNLEELSPEQLSYLSESELAQIVTDPRYKDAQLAALRALEERSTKGLTAEDEADMYKLQRNVSTQNRGRMGAIQNNMAVRGMSGSGMDALMQMQANQDATDREALAAMEKAGQIQSNKFKAATQLGQMGSQMRGQEFDEQAAKARAADEIKRFNSATRNQGLTRNTDIRNQGKQATWNRTNQVNDQNTTMGYNYDVEQANRAAQADAERRRRRGAVTGAIGGLAGAGAGALIGGPAGAGLGYQAGSTIFGYAKGGIVGEQDNLPYDPNQDLPENDTIPALLAPGEAVIPKSAMTSQEMFDQYTQRLKDHIKNRQGKVADAESGVQNAQYGSIFTDLLNNFNKANRKDTVLHNNIQNLGGKPTVIQGDYAEFKDTWSAPAKDELNRQDKLMTQDKADFSQSEAMRDRFEAKVRSGVEHGREDWKFDQEKNKAKISDDLRIRESDPTSEESKFMQMLAKEMLPSFDSSKMSAAELNDKIPGLAQIARMKQDKINQTQSQSDRALDRDIKLKQIQGVNDERDRKAKEMSATDTKYLTQLQSGMQAVDGMTKALAAGDNTFSLIGDNDFTRNARVAAEMYGRLQSGGAINKDEEDRFMKMLPGPTDSKEQQQKKLMVAKDYYNQAQANFQRGRPDLGISQVNPQTNNTINNLQLPVDDDEAASQARQKRIMELRAKAGK
jgi:hypothetical protein